MTSSSSGKSTRLSCDRPARDEVLVISRKTKEVFKRSHFANESDDDVKLVKMIKKTHPTQGMEENLLYVPIASLTSTSSCPPISGTLTHVGKWASTSIGTRYTQFTMRDDSGQISGVIFRWTSSDFPEKFVTGARFTVQRAKVKVANESYRENWENILELSISNRLQSLKVEPPKIDEAPSVVADGSSRTLIKDVFEKVEAHSLVDVIGVITRVKELKNVCRNGQSMMIRDFRIMDESSQEIEVTVWHKNAANFVGSVGSVVAIFRVAVRHQEFQNIKSLTFNKSSTMEIDPISDESERLKNWYAEWKSEQDRLEDIFNDGNSESWSDEESRTDKMGVERDESTKPTKNSSCTVSTTTTAAISPLVSIDEIHRSIKPHEIIDTAGLVISVPRSDQSRADRGNARMIRRFVITDDLKNKIAVDVGQSGVEEIDVPLSCVILLRKAKVGECEGEKKLKCFDDEIEVNPDIPETTRFKKLSKKSAPEGSARSRASATKLAGCSCSQSENIARELEKRENRESKISRAIPRNSEVRDKSNFTKIKVINERIAPGRIIDVLGIVKSVGRLQMVHCSNGTTVKLTMKLADETGETIWMTIWGPKANNLEKRKNFIVAGKRVQVRCWQRQKELNCTDKTSSLIVEPDIIEAQELRKWFVANQPPDPSWTPLSEFPLTLIRNVTMGKKCNILGILLKIDELKFIEVGNAVDLSRIIKLIDSSEKTIKVALLGENARDFEARLESVIFISNVRILSLGSDTKGCESSTSYLETHPVEIIQEMLRLHSWFAEFKLGRSVNFNESTERSECS